MIAPAARTKNDPFFTIQDIADELGVTDRTVRNLIKAEALEAVRVGRMIRVRSSALQRFLNDRSTRRRRRRKSLT